MFILHLISSLMLFVFVNIIPKCSTNLFQNFLFPQNKFSISIFWFCTIFWWWCVFIYLVFSEFISKPMSFLAFMRISVLSLMSCTLFIWPWDDISIMHIMQTKKHNEESLLLSNVMLTLWLTLGDPVYLKITSQGLQVHIEQIEVMSIHLLVIHCFISLQIFSRHKLRLPDLFTWNLGTLVSFTIWSMLPLCLLLNDDAMYY